MRHGLGLGPQAPTQPTSLPASLQHSRETLPGSPTRSDWCQQDGGTGHPAAWWQRGPRGGGRPVGKAPAGQQRTPKRCVRL